jgi:hypothetical protein
MKIFTKNFIDDLNKDFVDLIFDEDKDTPVPTIFVPPSYPNLIGVLLKKYFAKSLHGPAGWYRGEVVYFHFPYYHVVYEDGDEEDMTKEEVKYYAKFNFD